MQTQALPTLGAIRSFDAVAKTTVEGLGYELVMAERAGVRGALLRLFIDRVPGRVYERDHGMPAQFVTVEDCELVTRQLQYVLDVEGVDYARLEVSSPGLDRPLVREADYRRFAGQAVELTLKEAFKGRKHWRGLLEAGVDGAFSLRIADAKEEHVLGFRLDEVRSARLVPVLDFKGRRGKAAGPVALDEAAGMQGGQGR